MYDEILPVIEEHVKDGQDKVPTSIAEKWIEASCAQLKADFDLHFSIMKNVVCPRPSASDQTNPSEGTSKDEGSKKGGADESAASI